LFVEDDDMPMLAVKAKQNFDKRYLPPPIDLAWVKEYGALEGPQPDHLFGYRHWKDSDSTTIAFSIQQEYPLLSHAVSLALHFPFMSAQWKSPKNNQTHFQARPQGMILCFVKRSLTPNSDNYPQVRVMALSLFTTTTSSTPTLALSQLSRTQRTSPSPSTWTPRISSSTGKSSTKDAQHTTWRPS
jgi:hypothetical protein